MDGPDDYAEAVRLMTEAQRQSDALFEEELLEALWREPAADR